jgi:hypothetical protein
MIITIMAEKRQREVKELRVPPIILDPTMRKRGHTVSIDPVDETDDGAPDFDGAERVEAPDDQSKPGANTNTMLIVVFALVVIALIAMIVWMVMKQSNDRRDEEEVRREIQPHPHPRNSMPQHGMQYPNQQAAQHAQQHAAQQHAAQQAAAQQQAAQQQAAQQAAAQQAAPQKQGGLPARLPHVPQQQLPHIPDDQQLRIVAAKMNQINNTLSQKQRTTPASPPQASQSQSPTLEPIAELPSNAEPNEEPQDD